MEPVPNPIHELERAVELLGHGVDPVLQLIHVPLHVAIPLHVLIANHVLRTLGEHFQVVRLRLERLAGAQGEPLALGELFAVLHALLRALREGKRKDGTAIDPAMPWKAYGQMGDAELKAMYAYLRTVPPLPKGNR